MKELGNFHEAWKKLKTETQATPKTHWSGQANQQLLAQLVDHEAQENRERKRGIFFGSLGMATGLVTGVGLPVMMGALELTAQVLFGSALMATSLVLFFLLSKDQNPADRTDLPTLAYLQQVKRKLLRRQSKLLLIGFGYISLLLIGLALVFGQLEGFNPWWAIAPAALWGVLVMLYARFRYRKKIAPLLAEIDSLLTEMR